MNQPGISEFVVVWFARGEFLAIRDDGRIIGRGGSFSEAAGAALHFMGAGQNDFEMLLPTSPPNFYRYVPRGTPKG